MIRLGDDNKIDGAIRFFLCVLIFWLPYSPAVVESCVIISILLWALKRIMIAGKQKDLPESLFERSCGYLRCFRLTPSPINKPIAFFVAMCLISVLGSAFFDQSWRNFLTKTLEWFIIYFLVIEVFKTKKQVYTVLFILLFTSAATALDGIIQFHITHKDIFSGYLIEPGGRATASFKTANGLGAYLTIIFPLVLSLVFLKGKKFYYRFFIFTVVLLTAWALAVTFSRGAWLGVLFSVIFLPLVYFYHDRQRILFSVFGFISLTIICLVYFGLLITASFDLEALLRHSTVQWRLNIWRDSIVMIMDRPFFGHGINTFMGLFQYYRLNLDSGPTYAHNCYLQLAAETGLLGLISFLWILCKLFWVSLKKITFFAARDPQLMLLSSGLLSGILAFLIHSFFDTNFYSLQHSVYLWFMIGVLMSIYNSEWSKEEVTC